MSFAEIWKNSSWGRRDSNRTGPEAGMCLECSKSNKKAGVARESDWGVRSQGKEGERGPQTMKVSAETGAFSLVRGHPLEDFQQLRDIF